MRGYIQRIENPNKFARPELAPVSPRRFPLGGEKSGGSLPVAVRAATAFGRFGSVYVLTADGARLWGRGEPRFGRPEERLSAARKGLLDADPLGALVANAEAAGNSAAGRDRRAA